MSKFSFEDIGAVVATFAAQEGVQGGRVVKITGSGTVGPCGDGELFCGVAVSCRNGAAGVQVQGFVQVPVTLPIALGWSRLVADGSGGVMAAGEEEDDAGTSQQAAAAAPAQGVCALVVDVDTAGKRAVICL